MSKNNCVECPLRSAISKIGSNQETGTMHPNSVVALGDLDPAIHADSVIAVSTEQGVSAIEAATIVVKEDLRARNPELVDGMAGCLATIALGECAEYQPVLPPLSE